MPSGRGRIYDWRSEVYRADPDMLRKEVAYRFQGGRRLFYQPANPYDNYDFGVGSWMIQKNFVVAPAGATEGSRALEIWLMDVWPTLVNERFDQADLKPQRNQGGRYPPYSGNIPR